MKNTLGFLDKGLNGVDRNFAPAVPITRMPLADRHGLKAATAEYWLFLPYVLVAVAPTATVEPMAESARFMHMPSRMSEWELPHSIVLLGQRGKELGIRSNMVFGIPKAEAPVVENFIRSITIIDPEKRMVWALRLQEVTFLDPYANTSRPVDDPEELVMHANAFALDAMYELHTARAYLQVAETKKGIPTFFRMAIDGHGDPRLASLAQAVVSDSDPCKAELDFYDN